MKEPILLEDSDLRQAIREGLSEAGVNPDDAGYFETLIMVKAKDYNLMSFKKLGCKLCDSCKEEKCVVGVLRS